jgi:two-component SAPR family response regulator
MNGKRELIMVVDDERDILNILRSGLVRYGHKVMTFSDPTLALNELSIHHLDYKLLLTDVRMPGISGIELARKTREMDPQIILMLMTAFELSSYELSHDLPYVSSQDLLKKPISLSNICKVIDKRIGQ